MLVTPYKDLHVGAEKLCEKNERKVKWSNILMIKSEPFDD